MTFTFEFTEDVALIRHCICEPRVYRRCADDYAPPAEDFQPRMNHGLLYVLCWRGRELIGLWILLPHSPILYELHTCVLPEHWGPTALAAGLALLSWIWDNMRCQRLITAVPVYNRPALKIALRAGFIEWGVNSQATMKWGRLHDVTMLGISRPCPSSPVLEAS